MKNRCVCKVVAAIAIAAICQMGAWGQTIGEVGTRSVDGVATAVYVINVDEADHPRGNPYVLAENQDEVDAILAAGLPLWKEGTGTIAAGEEMANFTGAIYVTDGIYQHTAAGALGTDGGATFVDGGTLETKAAGDWGWAANTPASLDAESISFAGTGYNGMGALHVGVQSKKLSSGTFTLTGDTLFAASSGASVSMRGSALNWNFGGYKLTIKLENSGNGWEIATANSVSGFQELVLEKGILRFGEGFRPEFFQPGVIRIMGGAMLSLERTQPIAAAVELEDGARLRVANNGNVIATDYEAGGSTTRDVISGPVTLKGAVTNAVAAGKVLTISGKVSGSGSFVGGIGGWIRLTGVANTFAGGVSVEGTLSDDVVSGGLELGSGSPVSLQGGGILIENAQLQLQTAGVELPALSCDGDGLVQVQESSLQPTVASLDKTGTGTLTVNRAVKVLGPARIMGGTLKLGGGLIGAGLEYRRRLYAAPTEEEVADKALSRGTMLNSGTYPTYASARNAVSNDFAYAGADALGASMAYREWTTPDLTFSHHAYEGLIHVPGTEADVSTWNFACHMARNTWIQIDDETVLDVRDISVTVPSGRAATTYSDRFVVSDPIELTGGWHRIFVYFGNHYTAKGSTVGGGPVSARVAGDIDWEAYMGVGLNTSGTCSSNSADYVALTDPGDGSFLRIADSGAKASLDISSYRLSFSGPVTFAGGTTLDIGDVEPYTPLAVADTFTGATEVRNGVLKIAGEWVIDEDAIEAGFPLKAVDGAGIAFAEGATLTLPGVDAPMSLDGKAILFADENSTISGADNLTFVKSGANWRAVWSADRKTLVLKQSGLVISVR